MLESPSFQAWLDSRGTRDSVLWYHGHPAVGKTILTSIAINHVTESIDNRNIALTFMYIDSANPNTFLVLNLLGSMIRQLAAHTSNTKTTTKLNTFLKTSAKNRDMTEEDAVSWIETLSREFDVVYTFVDALDECPESSRHNLLAQLKRCSEGLMRVFLTSRSNVDVTVHIPHAIVANIDSIRNDITDYVDSKIQGTSRLAHLIAGNSGLKREIVRTINSQANGMFLLASLQIESLGDQTTASGVRLALKKLPADLFAMYDKTMDRIRDQAKQDAELGLKALLMMFGAQRTLTFGELRHALAVAPGNAHLDPEAFPHLEILLNATAGLVTTYDNGDYTQEDMEKEVHFVHGTLKEYFDDRRERVFPNLSFIMAETCLSYLCLEEFESGVCATGELFLNRNKEFCFFSYASQYWASHLRGVQTKLMDQSLAFVQNIRKTSAWQESFEWADLPKDPTCLTAQLQLSELCAKLISPQGINSRNSEGETLLHLAVIGNHYLTNLTQSGLEYQYATVLLILDHGADIEAKDLSGRTAAFSAVERSNGTILSLLLDRGANVNARMDDGATLLHPPFAMERSEEVWHILLDRSPDVNVLTNKGDSVIHGAVSYTTSAIVERLIDMGADSNLADSRGITPVLEAARQPCLKTLKILIERGAHPHVTDSVGRTPLHFSPLWYPHFEALETISRVQNIDAQDKKGRTPLHHAYYALAQSRVELKAENDIRHFIDETFRTPKYAIIVDQLIKLGASETIADVEGRIPEDYSKWSTYVDAMRWVNSYSDFTHRIVSNPATEMTEYTRWPILLPYYQPRVRSCYVSHYHEPNWLGRGYDVIAGAAGRGN